MSIWDNRPFAPSPLALEQAGEAWPQAEAAIRADLERELGEKGRFLMHAVSTDSGDFLCWPDDDSDGIYIDACIWEDGPVLESGPFKGKRVRMPRPASFAEKTP